MSPGPSRRSTLAWAAALLALIVVASSSVILIDSSPMSDPLQRQFLRPGSAPLPKTGTLLLNMLSNQNFSSIVSAPYASAVPVVRWPFGIVTVNTSVMSEAPISMSTDSAGAAVVSLLPGLYLLEAPYNTLSIRIPFTIYSGNTTFVLLTVSERAYPLLYSEAQDVGGVTSAYVEVRSSTAVAGAGDLATVGAQEVVSGISEPYQVKASVVADQAPSSGTQWLSLEFAGSFDVAAATSAVLATWSYSSTVTVAPTPVGGAQAQ